MLVWSGRLTPGRGSTSGLGCRYREREREDVCRYDTGRYDTALRRERKKTRLRDSFQKGILSGIARVPARSGRATSGGQIDDSQRAVWRNLAGPGGRGWKGPMSTVATAGQRGFDWLDAIARAFLQWLDAWQMPVPN